MHPYDHAVSTARIHGGSAEAFVPLHAWFDASKVAYCDFRHRALRHHHEGIAEARQLFGDTVPDSVGGRVAVDRIGLQHLEEDGSRIASAADWLRCLQPPAGLLPDAVPDIDTLAAASALRFGGDADDYRPLHAWFLATWSWGARGDHRHLVMRHHAFGSFEAEARFGGLLRRSDGGVVPTRVVAERHVRIVMGRVPPAHALLRHIRGEPWMLAAQHPDRLDRHRALKVVGDALQGAV